VEREESMNRNREVAQERLRKPKDFMGDRAEREEFKHQAQGAGQKEKQK